MPSKIGRFFRKSVPYLGALAGGTIGSVYPGVGTALGATIGYGLGGGVSSQLPRSKQPMTRADLVNQSQDQDQGDYGSYNVTNLPRGMQAIQSQLYSPEDQAAFGQMRETGLDALKKLPQAEFAPIAEEMQRQYREQVVPGIMEQFRGGDALQSSGFQQTLGAAGTGLQSKLAGMQQQFNQAQRGNEQKYGMDLLKGGLGRKFNTTMLGGDPQYWDSLDQGADDDSGEFDRYANPITEGILGQLDEYFSEKRDKKKEPGKNEQLKNLAQFMIYDRLKKQASLQPGN